MKKSIFTLAIIAVTSTLAAQKTLAQDLTIRTSRPITVIPSNFDPMNPFTWTILKPQTKPGSGSQLKTLSNEGGRKTLVTPEDEYGGASGGWGPVGPGPFPV